MSEPAKLCYTIQEAAKVTGVHKATIWKKVAAGELTTFKWCGRTLIRAEVLQASLDRADGRAA